MTLGEGQLIKSPMNLQSNWDRLGIVLSIVCAIHCLLTPLIILSLPIMARYYLANPFFHLVLALLIIPVGLFAFIVGYRHHHKINVLLLGIPGLVFVAVVPYAVHQLGMNLNETQYMILGSVLLISAHWINRRAHQHCRKCEHSH